MLRIGQMVQTLVFFGDEEVPMVIGRIVADRGSYYDVDIMGVHGGEPWIIPKPYSHVRPLDDSRR